MKYITNETIHKFKKIINHLHKKEEESNLNKKKKREESKQKNKIEKSKLNNINLPPPQYNIYPNMYMPPMQINNQNPAYFNEYQNIYYLNPPQSYQMNPQMISPFIANSYIMPPKTLEESVNIIYKRGIVNNIIGAFFIKECLDKQVNKEKRKVPVAKVELDEGNNDKAHGNNINKEEEDLEKENVEEKKEEENNDEKDKDKSEKNGNNELKMPSMV